MKSFVLAALLSSTNAAAAKVGDPCAAYADCGDASMCCGVATGGFVDDIKGAPTTVAISNNLAVCNKDPSTDGKPASEDWTGELKGSDTKGPTNIAYSFKGADFKCFDSPPPPAPTPKTPPTYPTKGVGLACAGTTDKCGGDETLCCGIAMNGIITFGDKNVNMPNASICNNAPVDKVAKAVAWSNMLLGGDY